MNEGADSDGSRDGNAVTGKQGVTTEGGENALYSGRHADSAPEYEGTPRQAAQPQGSHRHEVEGDADPVADKSQHASSARLTTGVEGKDGSANRSHSSTPPLTRNGGSLLRLFQSEVFDSYLHMHYLFKRREEGIHNFLVNQLYRRPDEEIHFYLPQLCQLAIVRYDSSALPRFLLDKAAKSMHLALKANWLFLAAWEDKIPNLADLAFKMQQETEMAVVNSKPSARDAVPDSPAAGGAKALPPDLFLRRRTISHLTRKRDYLNVVEFATRFLAARYPQAREIKADARASGSISLQPSEVSESPRTSEPSQSPGIVPFPTDAPPPTTDTDQQSVSGQQSDEPRGILGDPLLAPPQPRGRGMRRPKKGKIAPGWVSHTGPATAAGSKVKIVSVYSKLASPFNYSSFSRESHTALIDEHEMQQYIMKQRRCDYFELIGTFISTIIEVSDLLATEPDRTLRRPLVQSFLNSLNEWALCRRCIVAASEGIFAMTGLLIPFTHFGVEPERAMLGVPAPFQSPFLMYPTTPTGCAPSRFTSVQMLRVCTSECKVFSSRKRAPFLMIFELADLDEDISQLGDIPKLKRRREDPTTRSSTSPPAHFRNTSQYSPPAHSVSSTAHRNFHTRAPEPTFAVLTDLSWDHLYVFRCILDELKEKELFVPPFCRRPLTSAELERIFDTGRSSRECGYCSNKSEVVNHAVRPATEDATPDGFPFECPRCGSTKLFNDAIQNDNLLVALRRSLGVDIKARGSTTAHISLNIPPWGAERSSQKAANLDTQKRTRRSSFLNIKFAAPAGSIRSYSAGRERSPSRERELRGTSSRSPEISPSPASRSNSRLERRSSSVGPGGSSSSQMTSQDLWQSSRLQSPSVGPRSKKSSSTALPSLATIIGSAAGLVKPSPPAPRSVPQASGPSPEQTVPPGPVTPELPIVALPAAPPSSASAFPPLYVEGETSMEQAARVKRLIWPETWEKRKARLRAVSPYGRLKSWQLGAVIVKGSDDLRQELLASQLVRQFKAIFDEANLDLWLRPYEILVTGNHSGIMEYVPDAESLDSVKRRFNADSIHKVFEAAFADNPYEAKKNFIQSHAAYSLVGYLLQVKDRHNGNLLLDPTGRIVHIDYGFMLANSPGWGVNFETSPFKLSAELLAVMDGPDSDNFEYFRELVIRGFLETRKHADRILLAVEMMLSASKMPCFAGNPEAALSAIKERFMLNIAEEACIAKVLELLEISVNNWRTAQYDNFQRFTNGIF